MDGVAQGVEPAKKVDCGDLLPLDQPWESGWYRKVARLRVEVVSCMLLFFIRDDP